jgi:hypothetical protein
MTLLMASAVASSCTVNWNFSTVAVPGSDTSASSPSQVLHSQPLRENFCTQPARSPSE